MDKFEEYYEDVTETISFILGRHFIPNRDDVLSIYKSGVSFTHCACDIYDQHFPLTPQEKQLYENAARLERGQN